MGSRNVANGGIEQQLEFLTEGADLANRNLERLLSTQVDGCRDWLTALAQANAPATRMEQHLDQGLQLSCALFVAQVSAFTDGMHLLEKAVAEQHRHMLQRLAMQHTPLREPMQRVVCLGGCGYDSFSKATRQVANFASNRFAAAAVSAFQQARDKLAETA